MYIILKTRLAGFLLTCILLSGCATFKSDLTGKFTGSPEKHYGADRVRVLFIIQHARQTKGYDAIPKLDNKHQRINGFDDFLRDALNEFSNIENYATFTEYASDVNEPERRAVRDSLKMTHDFVIHIRFLREKSFAKHFLGSLFSTLSATLIPMPYSYSYSAEIKVFNESQQLIKTYSRKASLTKWVQTLLIMVYPFHPEKRKKEEIYVELLHDVFRQIESEKVLKR